MVTVLYSFPHRLGAAGIGTTAAAQVRGLVGRGHRVHVIAASVAPGAAAGAASVEQTLVVAGVRLRHRVLGRDRALVWHDRVVSRRLPAGRFDVVHCWPLASLATIAAARRAGVVSCREVPNTHTANAYDVAEAERIRLGVTAAARDSHRPNQWRLERELREYDTADVLLAPSEHVRQTFLDRGVTADRLARHRYGFDPDRFRPVERPGDGVFTALFVGRGEPRKGLHLALDAFLASAAARRGRFLICGEIIPSYRALLADRLAHPAVVELGHVADVAAVMAGADVFVLPSLEEGSALVTYEAAGAGCVRAVSDATGACCVHGEDALVHRAGDVGTLTRHLTLLATDPGTRERLRATTLARRSGLTWQAAAAALERAYGQPRRRASTG